MELTPAAELIANNGDLLIQILLCFPAKSLIRFKSVSKHWLSLISDSQFGAKHSRRNPRPSISGLFLCLRLRDCGTEHTKSVSLQGQANRPTLAFLDCFGVAQFRPKITHSCNGLLLCEYRYSVPSSGHYLVCNPTTKTYTLIPPYRPDFSPGFVPRSSGFLAFDPSKSRGYKVVFLCEYFSKAEKFYVHVYCSERASWKWFRGPDRRQDGLLCRGEVFCGGVIYWLSDEGVVFGFDIDSEKMIENTKIPCVGQIIYFGECDGHLILIQTHMWSTVKLKILEMDKDNNSRWIVKFQVNLEPLLSMGSEFCSYHVLCVVKGDKKEKDFELVLDWGGTIISYNLRCQTWNLLNDMAPGESVSHSLAYAAYPYIESLSPL
ncbi:hypothetical protein RHSIM_Rhsim01G0017800 [Rhododendron simsii]|uniref:F-box domain-containing protein n=1 Tax=Rhododendron simsii TaxID=118357 RepID=A0A834LX68_RHOSS|nr:hypothetical protein RHSIM_Rhsim01G0017800 [Rhododendron simsii]